MNELTTIELFEFLKTPDAQLLATDAQKLAAAQAWKEKLHQANKPLVPEFDPVAHLNQLRTERAEWISLADKHPADRVAERLAFYDQEIAKYESESVSA